METLIGVVLLRRFSYITLYSTQKTLNHVGTTVVGLRLHLVR